MLTITTAPSLTHFEILPIEQVPIEEVLPVINQSLNVSNDRDWFIWKHVENPSGKSLGWVAVSAQGVIGVRLFMRWVLQAGGRIIRAARPVDTATAPQARGRGVFRELTRFAVAEVEKDKQIALIFNTPNEQSRPGYSRMGWTVLPALAHGVRPLLLGRAAAIKSDDSVFTAFDHFAADPRRICTRRNAEVMRWRYDARSGVAYQTACLQQSEEPNAIIYRIMERKGIRLLVINELIGAAGERRLLVNSVTRRERARAALAATGSGALSLLHGPLFRRGCSMLAVRPLRALAPDPLRLGNWALTLGDLEQII
jgi:GNAT superfamily N-acetyltransferase